MKYLLALLLLISFPAEAEELYSDNPHCALIRNETEKSSSVGIRTDFYTKPDGTRSYYEDVLQLKPGEEREICAKGPFLPDYKVHLMIKSFFPLFECTTKLEGEISIRERALKPVSEARDVYATCVD